MAVVNFSIPQTLENKIREAIRKKGFASKAELFRFAVIRYLEETEQLPFDRNPRIASLVKELEKELLAKIGSKTLPSPRSQLARLKKI